MLQATLKFTGNLKVNSSPLTPIHTGVHAFFRKCNPFKVAIMIAVYLKKLHVFLDGVLSPSWPAQVRVGTFASRDASRILKLGPGTATPGLNFKIRDAKVPTLILIL